jgi:hypothetical protein
MLSEKEERLLAAFIPETTRHRTVAGLIRRWENLVEDVETGYRFTIDDYTNDLSIREIIDRIADATNPRLKAKLLSLLAPLDERFTEATFVSVKPPFPGALRSRPDAWWYARLPLKLVDELREDSERLGLISSDVQ